MTEFDELWPLQRANRYRAMAEDARKEAATATGRVRESYLLWAKRWEKLAEKVERSLKAHEDGR